MRIFFPLFNRATYARCEPLIRLLSKAEGVELVCPLASSILWDDFGSAYNYVCNEHPDVYFYRFYIDRHTTDDKTTVAANEDQRISWMQASILRELSGYLATQKYDLGIVCADRWETLPAIIALNNARVPTIHIQGGEITGCIDDKVRNMVSMGADYHACSTDLAYKYLYQMGQEQDRIWKAGCPSVDFIRENHPKIYRAVGADDNYLLCIFHPDTNTQEAALEQTIAVHHAIRHTLRKNRGMYCMWYYPNPDPGREKIRDYLDKHVCIKGSKLFRKAINEEPADFLRRLNFAKAIVGNSSCGIRESSYLGVPSVNVGDRQAIRERASNVIDVGYDKWQIYNALEVQLARGRYPRSTLYGMGKAAEHIVREILTTKFKVKGPLTYPNWEQFYEEHFGADRLRGKNHPHSEPSSVPGKPQGAGTGHCGPDGKGGSEAHPR